MDLRHNYIGRLKKDSFALYPSIKKLYMSMNKVHTVDADALEALTELELLDLSFNAIKEVPAGLPKSLHKLYLNGNPVQDTQHLGRAVGLQVLGLRFCDLNAYPALGLMPNLVELDVSENGGIRYLDPVQLAGTCRLAKLNVSGADLFPPEDPASHCQCRRVVEWARTYKIQVTGLGQCPDPVDGGGDVGGDDGNPNNCTRMPEAANAVFKECMAEWDHRNTPYWAICSGLVIGVALLMALCVCFCRRRRRHGADKVPGGSSPVDTKERQNNDSVTATADNKTEPAALLS